MRGESFLSLFAGLAIVAVTTVILYPRGEHRQQLAEVPRGRPEPASAPSAAPTPESPPATATLPSSPSPVRSSFTRVEDGESLAAVARRVYGPTADADRLWRANRDLLATREAPLVAGSLLRTP